MIAPVRRLRPVAWPLAVIALVLASAPFARSALRDAATLGPVTEGTLVLPPLYVVIAPLSDVLDTLTLLGARQHVATIATFLVAWLAWWLWRGRRASPDVSSARRAMLHAARFGLALLALLSVYAAVVFMPRPMTALEPAVNVLAVDFHAHTKESHDGRRDWTVEDVRAWHRDAGFGAVYVSDHRSFDGARAGWANNPGNAGEDVTILPAVEAVWRGEHVNILDADRVYRGLLDPLLRDVDEQALTLASTLPGKEPVLIETIPGDLAKLAASGSAGTAGMRAIEIVDGSPRGLDQTRRERARIVHLADSLNLALVSGSDHHGWGRTSAAWTLLYFPNWRAASRDQLADGVPIILRSGRRQATKVAERYVAETGRAVTLPFTVPLVAWGMLRALTTGERVSWIVWTIVLWLLTRVDWSRWVPGRRTLPEQV